MLKRDSENPRIATGITLFAVPFQQTILLKVMNSAGNPCAIWRRSLSTHISEITAYEHTATKCSHLLPCFGL